MTRYPWTIPIAAAHVATSSFMGWKDYSEFERAVLKFAWRRLLDYGTRFAAPKYSIPSVLTSLTIGFFITREMRGLEEALKELGYTFLYGIGLIAAAILGLLVWEIFSAPYRLWKTQRDTIRKVTARRYRVKGGSHSRPEKNGKFDKAGKYKSYEPGDIIEDLTEGELKAFPDRFERVLEEYQEASAKDRDGR